jgi:TRAP-type C4-dicarboxylate transport system substrate-binding protein
MKLSATFGLTAASVAVAKGLWSKEAVAAVSKEERRMEKEAEFKMNVATAYILGASRTYPIMQLDFKENVQNMTNGKVYVKLHPGGQLGVGSDIANKVQANTIQAGQHSLSNFAPFAPAADLINLPFWCGKNQEFVNLVTSKVWKDEVNPKIEAKGFKALFYVVIDPRVVAIRKGVKGPIKTPDQMKGIKFRVPGSKMLEQYYRMIGANPTPIAWGETSSALKEGVADALDPSVEALSIFGFKETLSWVTFTAAIPDSQVYSCNLEWLNSLPAETREGVEKASEVTFRQNLAKVPAARAYAMYQLQDAGVQFYTPTKAERQQWIDKAGQQLPAWDNFKKELAGSLDAFNKLLEAAQTYSGYYVDDV